MLLLQYAIHQRWLGLLPDLTVRAIGRVGARDAAAHRGCGGAVIQWLETLFDRYQAVTHLSVVDQVVVTQSCARRWLLMAHHAYATLRPASRLCWRNACRLDPQILRRPETM